MKQKLIDLIKNSDLQEADKNEWEVLINASPDEFAESFLEVFSQFPDEIGWFNETYKKKKEAFSVMKDDKAKGQEMLVKIYEEEKNKLEELAAKSK
jgi:hypothetical protein